MTAVVTRFRAGFHSKTRGGAIKSMVDSEKKITNRDSEKSSSEKMANFKGIGPYHCDLLLKALSAEANP